MIDSSTSSRSVYSPWTPWAPSTRDPSIHLPSRAARGGDLYTITSCAVAWIRLPLASVSSTMTLTTATLSPLGRA